MITLYNLRTDGDQYRITKFTDGEVESSYLCSEAECECPAGTRPTCRHRRMLPEMLTRDICNTHWFYDFDIARVVDLNGQLKSNLDALTAPAAEGPLADPFNHQSLGDAIRAANIPGVTVVDISNPQTLHDTIADAVGEPRAAPGWRRI